MATPDCTCACTSTKTKLTQSASLVNGSKEQSTVDLEAASRRFWESELGRDGRMGIGAVGLLALGWAGASAEVWWTILWILKKCLLTL